MIFPECLCVLIDCGSFVETVLVIWWDIQDQDDIEFGTEGPGFLNGQEDFLAVEDTVRGDPERLARFGEKLPHHHAGIADVRAFFIGAGPDQLDLVDCPLPGGGVLGESFESDGERGGGEAARLKGHQLSRQQIATVLRRPFGDRECGVRRLEAAGLQRLRYGFQRARRQRVNQFHGSARS